MDYNNVYLLIAIQIIPVSDMYMLSSCSSSPTPFTRKSANLKSAVVRSNCFFSSLS